jgi:hypothetical protein
LPKDKVFFLHIPRCGGTSVWRAVRGIYGRPNVFHISTKKDRAAFDAMTPEARRAFGAIGGHAPLSVFSNALDGLDGYYSVVTVRDPIDRSPPTTSSAPSRSTPGTGRRAARPLASMRWRRARTWRRNS